MARRRTTADDRERASRLAKELRRARGTSRSRYDLAFGSGVPVDTIKRIEDGRTADPGFFTIDSLAAALGIRLDELAARTRGGAKP